jgi:tripeptide aminopeptidase
MPQIVTSTKPARRTKQTRTVSPTQVPEPDLARALDLVMELMQVPGPSCHEGEVTALVREKLLKAGVPAAAILSDDAHQRSPAGGEVGNLIVRLPGTIRAPRRLMMAHLDTVPLCIGCKPERRGEYIESASPQTGLGADNRSGVAVVLAAALEISERKLPHPPLTLLFSVQEELGLFGTRFVTVEWLGKPKLAWNWDGRGPHRITRAATGGRTIDVTLHGIASHAGGAPERGVSAVAMAALGIHDLVTGGWHGEVKKGRNYGTSNLGIIHGGCATNVVTDRVEIKGECRSYDRKFLDRIVRESERAFRRAARTLRNDKGERGRAEVVSTVEYESFHLRDDEPCVQAAQAAIQSFGMEPELLTTQSALDANWMNFHGIPTATLGAGQMCGHSVEERLDIKQFQMGCRVGLRLATGG